MPKRTRLLAMVIVVSLTVSACGAINSLSFMAAPESGNTDNQKIELYYLQKQTQEDMFMLTRSFVGSPGFNKKIKQSLKEQIKKCPTKSAKGGKMTVIPDGYSELLSQVLSFAADFVLVQIEKLRTRAQKSYGARVVVGESVPSLKDQCFVLVRYKQDSENSNPQKLKKLGMVIVVRLHDREDGLTFVPTFLWFGNAVAETAKAQDSEKPKINVAIGIVVKALVMKKGQPEVRTLTAESFNFPDVSLGEEEPKVDCKEFPNCRYESDIVPKPITELKGGSITISVVETGSAATDLDRAQAEIIAIKAALGPIIKEVITTR